MADYKAINFFCSGEGRRYGLRQARICVLAGIDFASQRKEAYDTTNHDNRFVEANIKKFAIEYFENGFFIRKDDNRFILMNNVPKETTWIHLTDYQTVQ
jgi:site-specific DNA-cytosine methylase